MLPSVSVIVTTYNRSDALRAVLQGYAAQSSHDFELLVADDGSKEDTATVVKEFARSAPFEVKHVWQPDEGFRAAAARNRALAQAQRDYVVFTDGDCIPSSHFVRRHQQLAEPGWFLSANRVLLSPRFTEQVVKHKLPVHEWSAARWSLAWLKRDINRLLPLLHLPDGKWRKTKAQTWQGAKTCNLSAWLSDLVRVNGFNEAFNGWGLEDSDLVIRLLHAGVQHKNARFAAPVFHLWHHENDRSRLQQNQTLLNELLKTPQTYVVDGLDKYK